MSSGDPGERGVARKLQCKFGNPGERGVAPKLENDRWNERTREDDGSGGTQDCSLQRRAHRREAVRARLSQQQAGPQEVDAASEESGWLKKCERSGQDEVRGREVGRGGRLRQEVRDEDRSQVEGAVDVVGKP